MPDESLIAGLAALLAEPAEGINVAPGPLGGNNRIFVVNCGGRRLLAKSYFRDPTDPRDRLKAEFEFLTYTAALGLGVTPKPVARDAARNLGVYEYVEGRTPAAQEIDGPMIEQAIRFFLDINPRAGMERAMALPMASEACFTVNEHLATVDRRISRLQGIPAGSPVNSEGREFVVALSERWESVKARIVRRVLRSGRDPAAAVIERCVSPSDFGFHNSILRPSGALCFVDFEYAGWDDPAKMAGDFFCHPAMALDRAYFDRFLSATMRFSAHATELEERARLLFPVFQTKWCCIILNDFLPGFFRHRRFADPRADELDRKRGQLDKAKRLFGRIEG